MKRRSPRQRIASRRNLIIARRKRRAKDGLGYWAARGIKKVASKVTFGATGFLADLAGPSKKKRK